MYLLNERIDPTVKELEEEFKMLVRDISIDVHRAYLSKHKEEHEAKLGKKTEIAQEKPLEESLCASISSKVSPNSSCARSMCSWHTLSPFCFIVTSEAIEEADGRKPELKPAKVMEAGTAFELRALRHAHRVEEIGKVLALDNDKVFVEACKRNRQFNGYVACSKVEAYLADARVFKVDLDPYSSPSVFSDSTVQSVSDGGILMCTTTGVAVLHSGNGEVGCSKLSEYIILVK